MSKGDKNIRTGTKNDIITDVVKNGKWWLVDENCQQPDLGPNFDAIIESASQCAKVWDAHLADGQEKTSILGTLGELIVRAKCHIVRKGPNRIFLPSKPAPKPAPEPVPKLISRSSSRTAGRKRL